MCIRDRLGPGQLGPGQLGPQTVYSPNIGSIYPIQIHILQNVRSLTLQCSAGPAPKKCTETLQLTHFPQLLVAYIQYKYIYVTKCTFPNLVPKGRIETLQLTHIPQMLAAYIQYKYKYYRMYFPKPCAQKMRE